MAAAAAGNMENLEMLSSLLGTQHILIQFHKFFSENYSLWIAEFVVIDPNKELELQDKGYETINTG